MMPTAINLTAIGIWFCVGFFTGLGWALGVWVITRSIGRI